MYECGTFSGLVELLRRTTTGPGPARAGPVHCRIAHATERCSAPACLQQLIGRQGGFDRGHRIDERRLVFIAPGRRCVSREAWQPVRAGRPARQSPRRRWRPRRRGWRRGRSRQGHRLLARCRPGHPDDGGDGGARGAPLSSSPSSLCIASSDDSSSRPDCACASRQNSTSAACSDDATWRRLRKSNAARKRGWVRVRNTRLRWRELKRDRSSQISLHRQRSGAAARWCSTAAR